MTAQNTRTVTVTDSTFVQYYSNDDGEPTGDCAATGTEIEVSWEREEDGMPVAGFTATDSEGFELEPSDDLLALLDLVIRGEHAEWAFEYRAGRPVCDMRPSDYIAL